MKRKMAFAFVAAMAALAGGQLFAQGRFGANSAECIQYLSYYQEHYRNKNYDAALPNWRKAYALCPHTASQNMFIHGTTMMTRLYNNTSDKAYRAAIVDTILMLQDQRMAAFPMKRTEILNNKGQYMINYRGNDAAYLQENLSAILADLGPETSGSVLVNLLQSSINLFKEKKVSATDVIAMYDKVSGANDAAPTKTDAEREEKEKVKASLGAIFADSKVASCDMLINIFTPRYKAEPENLAVVSNIVRMLGSVENCTSNDLYLKAVTSMYKLDPSYRSAYALYRLNAARDNVSDACRYLEEAIQSEGSDEVTDAQYAYELALFCYKHGVRGKANEAARKAIALDHGFAGKAYMVLGNLWAGATCSEDVDKYARYWVATDNYQKAKGIDPALADEANTSIANVTKYYPDASEMFMYDLSAGQTYTVSCGGISATTTVRVHK